MPKVISVHEYVLKPDSDHQEFENALLRARERGLLQLPGLVDYFLMKGIRGYRKGAYAAIWIYESEEAWARLWGPVGQLIPKERYPESWIAWENQVLAPFLAQDPDQIHFTSYKTFASLSSPEELTV